MNRGWYSFLHNCVAHPLLFWTASSRWSLRFHDWSSHKMHPKFPKLYVRAPQ